MNKHLYSIHPDDEALMCGLVAHSNEALEQLYRQYYSLVQKMIVANSGAPADAQDIFQEGVIVLFEKVNLNSFTLECKLKTYLYSVCKHLWLKKLEAKKIQAPFIDDYNEMIPVQEDVEERKKRDQQFDMMALAMNQLGEPCRSILENYYHSKMSMQEIAAKFGYTNAENAKNQKYKCLMRLKKLFFAQYKNDGGNK